MGDCVKVFSIPDLVYLFLFLARFYLVFEVLAKFVQDLFFSIVCSCLLY